MSFPVAQWPDLPASLIAEVKAFVRIDHDADDDAIAAFLRSAAGLCEDFTGLMLIARSVTDVLPAWQAWQKLKRLPVQAIVSVEAVEADGSAALLAVDDYAIDIDSEGLGWVRMREESDASRIRIVYSCGLAADWDQLPAGLRQGIVRLAGYLYANRDGVDIGGPPSAVTALWRPYRRMRIA
ncbi:head-tail connector protein [Parasphingorhabdus sp.]|uniref:head-tail connector protein n=1 Tax=Parasphingorhabdus sp. TaxID=2709688 RepID=UPI003A906742